MTDHQHVTAQPDNLDGEPRTLDEAVIAYAAAPEPCLGCEHRAKCVGFRLACEGFVYWVENGKANGRPRVPNAASYLFLYPEDIQGKPSEVLP